MQRNVYNSHVKTANNGTVSSSSESFNQPTTKETCIQEYIRNETVYHS